jgi:hypothetical protein
MKKIIISLFLSFNCLAKDINSNIFTLENFDDLILSYSPQQRENVSDKAYKHGIFILKETKAATHNDPKKLNSADYWNLTMAFLSLKEPNNHLKIVFKKAITEKNNGMCDYLQSMGIHDLDTLIPDVFNPFYATCNTKAARVTPTFDLDSYAQNGNYDNELIQIINNINEDDIRYRKHKPVDWNKQTPLDLHNQKLINQLYKKYKTYIGQSLVGEKFASTMWAVIQHSNPKMMGQYLPVVHQATKDNELGATPLKMLIDRYYGLTKGYQVFGSQSGFGFNMADEKTRKEIETTFDLNNEIKSN